MCVFVRTGSTHLQHPRQRVGKSNAKHGRYWIIVDKQPNHQGCTSVQYLSCASLEVTFTSATTLCSLFGCRVLTSILFGCFERRHNCQRVFGIFFPHAASCCTSDSCSHWDSSLWRPRRAVPGDLLLFACERATPSHSDCIEAFSWDCRGARDLAETL